MLEDTVLSCRCSFGTGQWSWGQMMDRMIILSTVSQSGVCQSLVMGDILLTEPWWWWGGGIYLTISRIYSSTISLFLALVLLPKHTDCLINNTNWGCLTSHRYLIVFSVSGLTSALSDVLKPCRKAVRNVETAKLTKLVVFSLEQKTAIWSGKTTELNEKLLDKTIKSKTFDRPLDFADHPIRTQK